MTTRSGGVYRADSRDSLRHLDLVVLTADWWTGCVPNLDKLQGWTTTLAMLSDKGQIRWVGTITELEKNRSCRYFMTTKTIFLTIYIFSIFLTIFFVKNVFIKEYFVKKFDFRFSPNSRFRLVDLRQNGRVQATATLFDGNMMTSSVKPRIQMCPHNNHILSVSGKIYLTRRR